MRHLLLEGVVVLVLVGAVLVARSPRTPSHGTLRSAPPPPPRPPLISLFGEGPGRNLVNLRARRLPTDWSATPGKEHNLLWSADLGSTAAVWGPAVYQGKIFVGTNNNRPRDRTIRGDRGVLMCFRASDGRFLWQATHAKLVSGRINDWPEQGIHSRPAVQGDRLYYVSNRCELVCAGTEGKADGSALVHWRLDLFEDLKVRPHNLATCSPLLVGDRLFVTTSNGVDEGHVNVPAPTAPSFLAVDSRTGKILWTSSLPGKGILHGQWSNPTYAVVEGAGQVVFPAGDGWLYAFAPDTGRLLWKFDCNPKASVYRLGPGGTRNSLLATPVVWEGKLYIGVGDDPEHKKGVGHLWCLDLVKATRKGKVNRDHDVSPRNDHFDGKAPVNRDSALLWHFGGPAGIDEERDYLFGRTLSTCAVHEGLCYAVDFDGVVVCLDAQTGNKHWEHDMEADTWSSPYWADGHVYIGNDRGVMHVFRHGKKKQLVRTIHVGRGASRIRSTPVAVDEVLYLTTENPARLYALGRR